MLYLFQQNRDKMTTSTHINGFWSHITWSNEIGTDQHGRKWINIDKPELANQDDLDSILDAYNQISKSMAATT